jgi:hypothetical protein
MLQMLQADVSSVLDVCFKYFFWMLHMLEWLYTHVSSACFKVFTCFRLKLQVFHLDAVKLDLDVAYIVMTKCFICFLTYVANIFSECFKSRSERTHVSSAATALLLLLGALTWIIVRVLEAGRRLRSKHMQVG